MPQWTSLAETMKAMPADERDFTDEQFAMIAQFASAPLPALPTASTEEIGKLMATMASTLKRARTEHDQGRLKVAVYVRMLQHLPHDALKFAAHRALATLEWMPSPAELLKLAEQYAAPEHLAHGRARVMAARRTQRLFEETLRKAKDRTLTHEELQALPDHTARVAETQASIIIRMDGERVYRTKENIALHLADQEWGTGLEGDERINRADDAPERVKSGGSVGSLAAEIMAEVEVSDV